MEKMNFSDTIHASGRNLYLQTNTADPEEKMVSVLFDGGRVLNKKTRVFGHGLAQEQRHDLVLAFHQEQKQALEFIYQISSRVKTVRHPRSLIKLARQFLNWNLIDEAIYELEYALQYDKNIAEIYLYLSEAYIKRGAPDEAADLLKQGVEIFPDYADLWNALAKAAFVRQDFETVGSSIDKALDINSGYVEAHLLKCRLFLQHILADDGKNTETENQKNIKNHLNRVLLSEQYGSRALDNACRCFHNQDWSGMMTCLNELIDTHASRVDLDFHDLFYLQYLFGEAGKKPETVNTYVETLETLTRKHPKFPDLHNMLGIGYLIQCRILFNKALHQFRIACKLNPLYEKARNNLKLAQNDGKGFLILLRAMLK